WMHRSLHRHHRDSHCSDHRRLHWWKIHLSSFAKIAAVAAPLYIIVLSPPQHRGTISGMYKHIILLQFNNCHMCCLWLELASHRCYFMASLTLAANAVPWVCVFGSLVLFKVASMVQF
ncbi:uncharacterized protein A1O9_01914, partial [Exophiala aquamarina CBS 119918]